MANVKLSQLLADNPASDFDGTEIIEVTQGGQSKGATSQQMKGFVGGSSYLVYTALLSQSGTSAPSATVLQSTLGGTVVWTYNDIGQYVGTLTGVFTVNKTTHLLSPMIAQVAITLDVNSISLFTGDFITGNGANNILDNHTIEIRVYP